MMGDWIYNGMNDSLASLKYAPGLTAKGQLFIWHWKYEVRLCYVWFTVIRSETEFHFNKGREIRITTLGKGRFIVKRKWALPGSSLIVEPPLIKSEVA